MKPWKGFQRGVNFGGWFSQCVPSDERYDSFITEEDFRVVAQDWGCDHIRVPVDYILVEDPEGNPKEAGYQRLDRCIALCRKYGLHMLLDLHAAYGYSFGADGGLFQNADLQERFCRLWERFAQRYGKESELLAFDLLNEITAPAYAEIWRDLALRCIARIRVYAPETDILIGGHSYNSIKAVPELPEPPDAHIVYSFHNYDPKVFTHQNAFWMPRYVGRKTPYLSELAEVIRRSEEVEPGSAAEFRDIPTKTCGAEMYLELFRPAVELAERRGVSLYCGEYGVIDQADIHDTVRWYREISAAFRHYGIGRCAWTYRQMDFGLSDERMKPVLAELLPLL